MRKRKTTYPAPRNASRPVRTGGDAPAADRTRPSLVTIDTSAISGRSGLAVGDRVLITSTGLYSGETAVVETLVGGPIPAALVRTEAGGRRRVRTIDLRPAGREG